MRQLRAEQVDLIQEQDDGCFDKPSVASVPPRKRHMESTCLLLATDSNSVMASCIRLTVSSSYNRWSSAHQHLLRSGEE